VQVDRAKIRRNGLFDVALLGKLRRDFLGPSCEIGPAGWNLCAGQQCAVALHLCKSLALLLYGRTVSRWVALPSRDSFTQVRDALVEASARRRGCCLAGVDQRSMVVA